MQAVILAGGLGTRLRPLALRTPKSMIPVEGRPFLAYQMDLLRAHGVERVVLCVGHLAEQVVDFFGTGESCGVSIEYTYDGEQLVGTGGALGRSLPFLEPSFLLLYGDVYLPVDFRDLARTHARQGLAATMVVHRNRNRWDMSNVRIESGRVVEYRKNPEDRTRFEYIDAGVAVLSRSLIESESGRLEEWSLERELYPAVAARRQMWAYVSDQRFYEIGSASGLEEFRALVKAGIGKGSGR